MALITCKNCGNLVSDKAIACPHCGAPVGNNTQQTEQQSNGYNTQQPVEYSHYKEPERKSNTWLIAALVAGIVALLGIGGWLLYDNHQKQVEQERQLAILAEKARQDSIAAAELREQARQDSIAKAKKQEKINTIYNEYANVLKSLRYSEIFGYFLLDLTGDGVPELCFNDFLPEEYSKLPGGDEGGDEGSPFSIISIQDNRAKRIFSLYDEGCYWPGAYYHGKDYIIVEGELCGGAPVIAKIYCTNGGTMKIKKIFEDFFNEKPYPKIKEPKVTWNDIRDFETLKNQIKSFITEHQQNLAHPESSSQK